MHVTCLLSHRRMRHWSNAFYEPLRPFVFHPSLHPSMADEIEKLVKYLERFGPRSLSDIKSALR